MLRFALNMEQNFIKENIFRVQERIAAAARKVGRSSSEITLIAVSKTHPADVIRAAYDAGLRHFGENRVQEWEGKRGPLIGLSEASWHLVGHLQGNKAARAARLFHSVDSVDDFALAQRLDRARVEDSTAQPASPGIRGKLRVLMEVHIAGEEAKSGVAIEDLPALAEKIPALANLDLAGLMCVPPLSDDLESVRPYFQRLRQLRDELRSRVGLALPVLSMGMSHDFEVAIEEGATEVRIGTAVFGHRPPPV
jgi:pyridoxal phosphate enzyme (YggS family)